MDLFDVIEDTLWSQLRDVDFGGLIASPPSHPPPYEIPKVAHFIHSQVHRLTWLDYACIRTAFEYLGVGKINIWVPLGADLPGDVWKRVQEMSNVVIRRIILSNSVWGIPVVHPAHVSDIVRLKVVYEEGGRSYKSPFANWC